MNSFVKGIFLFVFCSSSFAVNANEPVFSIIPQGPLPSSISAGSSLTVAYTVTNNMSYTLEKNGLRFQPKGKTPIGVTQITNMTMNPPSCSDPFTLKPGQSCTLVLNINANSLVNGQAIGGPEVCNSKEHPVRCSIPSVGQELNIRGTRLSMLYVADNSSDFVSICSLNNNGSINSCEAHADSTFSSPIDIILNNSATLAYVANTNTNQISVCSVNANGGLGNCTLQNMIFNLVFSGLRINSNNSLLYITSFNFNEVFICQINPVNGFLTSCITDNGEGIFNDLDGRLVFNLAGTKVYVANSQSKTIIICNVNPVNGTFFGCTPFSDPSFIALLGLDINAAGTHIYSANGPSVSPTTPNGSISICPINPDGSLSPCTVSGGLDSSNNPTFNFDDDNATNSFVHTPTNIAYIPNGGNNTVSICPVNPNGSFGVCTVCDATNACNATFNTPDSAWVN